jgi:hypothetical protein
MRLMYRFVQIAAMVAATITGASGCNGATMGAPTDAGSSDGTACYDGTQGIPPHYTITAAQACQLLEHVHGAHGGMGGITDVLLGPGCESVCAGFTGCGLDSTFTGAVMTLNPSIGSGPIPDSGLAIKNCPTDPPTSDVQCEELVCGASP